MSVFLGLPGASPVPSVPSVPDRLSVLYRGPLASCNYDCPYCPFAKRVDPPPLLREDRAALGRFVDWVVETTDVRLSILFTPWGEGLIRSWYREAIVRLSHQDHVDRVSIQTNLAARVDWMADAAPTAALWATYHPGQVTLERFLARCRRLDEIGRRYSVGVVGLPGHHEAALELRAALEPSVYLWVNAAEGHTYSPEEEARWTALDPRFGDSVRPHVSFGQPCHAGESAVSVIGDGTVRRCHFIDTPLGNLYDGSWRQALRPRPCTNRICDCHIGYVHLKPLGLYDVYGPGVLERILA
ncbi:radical SAM protein [Kineosporia sp. J2-2]|uniref:Radical SAM protein n=1 Tax=Kineosporia corallincola TaxID=2835133 RepID=A0ABS5TQN9_9ACTN|nr:STM4011 family radical SAM protein [Kineosporia corallincola]MBT0772814.1 radical SAM protein [Kineosporia corallincola]